jgi:hypothetical protein
VSFLLRALPTVRAPHLPDALHHHIPLSTVRRDQRRHVEPY